MGTPVDRSQLQPGDLVFFNGLGHMGIYVGGGSFIHSPHTGDVVKISSMSGLVRPRRTSARAASKSDDSAVGLGVEVSISCAKCSCTTRRRSLSVGVISSCSALKSRGEDREALDLLEA